MVEHVAVRGTTMQAKEGVTAVGVDGVASSR
jgi:hypothetical protein